jgi:hypothetical protein
MSAAAFVNAARSMVSKATWRHRGRQPHAVDCIGLLVVSGRLAGLHVEDEKGYGREPWEDRLRKGLARRFGAELPASEAQAGDVALLRWSKGEPSHTGIIANHPDGGLSLIHAHTLRGVIEQSLSGNTRAAVISVFRPDWSGDVH